MRTSSLLITSFLLTGFAVAQDTTATSALTVTTRDPMVARGVLRMFQSQAELPEIGNGVVAVLSLDDGGNIAVREGSGDTWLRIDARPGQLMDLFAPQVAQGRQMAQMMGGMALGQAGFGFEEIDEMIGAAFGFPRQIDALTVVIPTEYEPGQAMTVDVDLKPKTDTWLGTLVANLQATAGGVPMLPAAGKPMVRAAMNVDTSKVMDQMLPLIGVFSGMGQPDKEAKANAAKMQREALEAGTGAMSVAFDFQNGAKMIMALRDAAKMKELMANEKYWEMSKAAAEASGMAEATIEPNALTHRDVQVMRSSVVYDNPQMSPFGADEMETYTAVAGNMLVTAMLAGAKAEIQALIDDALDQKLKTAPLAGGALMTAEVDVAAMIDMMAQQGMPADAEDAPEKVSADLKKANGSLQLHVRIQ